ncbi:MAG: ATP-dependent Clp protease proteolytic subunit [Oscillospiraceae bacterium]|nr:ATP-dependent Clp protease proteolytic subunit [Oscillospiraceae bacterium]
MRKTLNGAIVSDGDQWLYDYFNVKAFSPGMVRAAIEEAREDGELVLEINSGGGDVFAGFEMYGVLRGAQDIATKAEVQSLAGSAASYVMLGCDEVTASPMAQVMVHMPSTRTAGNQQDHRDSIAVLDSITESILNAYELKSAGKATRAEFRRLMKASTWMPAQEALRLGLIDSILGGEVPGGVEIVNSALDIPSAASLRARWEDEQKQKATEEDADLEARRLQCLNRVKLEQARFI